MPRARPKDHDVADGERAAAELRQVHAITAGHEHDLHEAVRVYRVHPSVEVMTRAGDHIVGEINQPILQRNGQFGHAETVADPSGDSQECKLIVTAPHLRRCPGWVGCISC
jgi:hypothetical protein